ncbi:MAG TPA: ATP-binding protein [Rhodocyclaceae bacterium]|nr:ATP-binding protein [Rhodocyclaceae bacterium]
MTVRWLFLLAMLPGVFGCGVLFFSYLDERRDDLEVGALHSTRALAQSIDKDLAGLIGQLQVLASSPHLRSGNFSAFHRQAQEVITVDKLAGAIVLADENGQLFLSTLRPWGTALPMTAIPDVLRRTIASGGPTISDLYIGGVTGKPYVSIQIPVQVKGRAFSLAMGIPAERLADSLSALRLPGEWLAVICDSTGKVIARSQKHGEMVGKDALPQFMEAVAKNPEGTVASQSLEGVPTFAAFKRSELSGWTAAIAIPQVVLYQNLYGPLGLTGLVVVFSLLISSVLAFVFSCQVESWLGTLMVATRSAGDGNVDVSVPVSGPREIAELAQQFNAMQTSHKQMRQVRERLTRALELLSESNMALLYADEEARLLPEVCRLIVEKGGYLMAWVGLAEPDAEQSVRPAALSGAEQDYLSNIRVSWGDNALGRGPTGLAIRTGKTHVNQNILTNPNMAPWLQAAVRRGYQSSIALPLAVDGAVVGALTIYAAEAEAFGPEEVALLEKLTNNLAFGIERLRTRNQLAVANRELQGFTYAASHDMKAPLQRIVTFSGMLERLHRDKLAGDAVAMLDFITMNAKRMMSLVEDLLDHSQIEQIAMTTRPVSLKDAVAAILEEKKADFADAGAEVMVQVPDIPVMANPLALSQVLRNLVSNALKYSCRSTPPTIAISGQRVDGACRLAVQDNGVGFDMAYHDRIFEIFRRLHTYVEFPGSGVGLALVKKAMERMGGRVWAKSEPGQGATFFIELPMAKAGGPEAAASSDEERDLTSGAAA